MRKILCLSVLLLIVPIHLGACDWCNLYQSEELLVTFRTTEVEGEKMTVKMTQYHGKFIFDHTNPNFPLFYFKESLGGWEFGSRVTYLHTHNKEGVDERIIIVGGHGGWDERSDGSYMYVDVKGVMSKTGFLVDCLEVNGQIVKAIPGLSYITLSFPFYPKVKLCCIN